MRKNEKEEKDNQPGDSLVISDVFYYEQRDSAGRLKSFQGKKLKNKNRILESLKRLLGFARV